MQHKSFNISIFFTILLWGFSLSWQGCAHYANHANHRQPDKLPLSLTDQFNYPKTNPEYQTRIIKQESAYTIKRIEFDSTYNVLPLKHQIIIDYYCLKKMEKSPAIVLLPIMGGDNIFIKKFAAYFAENGYAAIIVHRQDAYKKIEDIDEINTTLKQIVIDHKQALDWVEKQPELDKNQIGIFGISMGGISALLVYALDHRIKAGVFALAGGDLPYILAYSKDPGVAKRRNIILKKNSLNIEQLYTRLQNTITCDPINYVNYMDARKTMMILAIFDNSVPYAKGKQLWREMDKPEVIYLFSGHYTSLLYLPYVKYQALSFFKKMLPHS